MKRDALIRHIETKYHVQPEYLWAATPRYAIFRRADSRKWFCALVDISGHKLGLPDAAIIDVLNVKVVPELVGSLRQMKGFFPAYHMNKEHWVSLLLSGGPDQQTIFDLIDAAYGLSKK